MAASLIKRNQSDLRGNGPRPFALQSNGEGVYAQGDNDGGRYRTGEANDFAAATLPTQSLPANHTDRKLYDSIRERLPDSVPDEKALEATVQAKTAGHIRQPSERSHAFDRQQGQTQAPQGPSQLHSPARTPG